nr:hypothetical protein GCM10020093_050710 [Planobispora longispora]
MESDFLGAIDVNKGLRHRFMQPIAASPKAAHATSDASSGDRSHDHRDGRTGRLRHRAAAPAPATIVVAADGSGNHTTVQEAVNAVPAGNTRPVTILVREGTYKQQVVIPADKPYISLVGDTDDPRKVVLTFDAAAKTPKPDGSGAYGTSGSASYVIGAPDFTARNLTFENSYDEVAGGNSQAVAVRTTGDRQVYENVRFIGNQDTLYANTASATAVARQYYRNCYVEGDVDFIFGRATALFHNCVIKSLDRGSADGNNGYVTAASTEITNPYGFMIYRSHLVGDAPAKTVHLGRPWRRAAPPPPADRS